MNIPAVTLTIASIIAVPIVLTIHRKQERKKQKEDLHKKVQEAFDTILEDGVVEGPKGKYKTRRRRWAKKWLNYSNSLVMMRGRYEMTGGDLPTLEKDG